MFLISLCFWTGSFCFFFFTPSSHDPNPVPFLLLFLLLPLFFPLFFRFYILNLLGSRFFLSIDIHLMWIVARLKTTPGKIDSTDPNRLAWRLLVCRRHDKNWGPVLLRIGPLHSRLCTDTSQVQISLNLPKPKTRSLVNVNRFRSVLSPPSLWTIEGFIGVFEGFVGDIRTCKSLTFYLTPSLGVPVVYYRACRFHSLFPWVSRILNRTGCVWVTPDLSHKRSKRPSLRREVIHRCFVELERSCVFPVQETVVKSEPGS